MTQPYPLHPCCRHHTRESVCREAASFKRAWGRSIPISSKPTSGDSFGPPRHQRAAKARHEISLGARLLARSRECTRRCARRLVPAPVLGEGRGENDLCDELGLRCAAFDTRKAMLITSATIIHSHSCSSPTASGSVLESMLARAVSRARRSWPPDRRRGRSLA